MNAIYIKLLEYLPFLPSFADWTNSLEDHCWKFAGNAVYSVMGILYGTGYAMYNILSGTSSGKGILSGEASFISQALNDLMTSVEANVVPAMSSLGIAIAVTFWLMGFIEMVSEDRMSPEMFAKHFSKLAIAVGLCMYAKELVSAVRTFGDGFAKLVMTASLSLNITGDNVFETTPLEIAEGLRAANPDTHFVIIIGMVLCLILPIYLVSAIMIVVCYIIQVTRVLEMSVRGAFLPVALGLLADDGWRGAGGRYIKKFIAICCQGGVLIFIGQATQYLMSYGIKSITYEAEIFTVFQSLLLSIAVGIACISVMFKSIGFVNDIFGA